MSFDLSCGVTVQMFKDDEGRRVIFWGQKDEIPIEEFLRLVEYVLTMGDLNGNDDPRYKFLERMKQLQVIEGHNPEGKRLGISPTTPG